MRHALALIFLLTVGTVAAPLVGASSGRLSVDYGWHEGGGTCWVLPPQIRVVPMGRSSEVEAACE
jgi:hypothetical protein